MLLECLFSLSFFHGWGFLSFQWLKSLDLLNVTFAQSLISSFSCLCILGGHTRYTKMGSLCHMLIYYVYVRPFVCYFLLVIHHYMYLSSSSIWSSRMGYIYGINRWWDCVWLICSHNFLLSLVLICSTFQVALYFSSLFLFLYSCMLLNKDKKIQCLGLRFVFLVYKVLPLLRCFIGYSGQQGQCVLISLYNTRHRISSCNFLSWVLLPATCMHEHLQYFIVCIPHGSHSVKW